MTKCIYCYVFVVILSNHFVGVTTKELSTLRNSRTISGQCPSLLFRWSGHASKASHIDKHTARMGVYVSEHGHNSLNCAAITEPRAIAITTVSRSVREPVASSVSAVRRPSMLLAQMMTFEALGRACRHIKSHPGSETRADVKEQRSALILLSLVGRHMAGCQMHMQIGARVRRARFSDWKGLHAQCAPVQILFRRTSANNAKVRACVIS